MAPKPYSRIRSAAIDGRLQNPFFRKTQLKNLHDALVSNHQAIQDAIAHDTGYSSAEVKVEFYAAIKCIKDTYESIDPQKFFKEEYRVANGKDAADNTEPVGAVVIEPNSHTLFFSILSPLSSAIAAGNCVLLQLENTLLQTPSLLRGLLKESLDNDIIDIVSSKVDENELNTRCVYVLQNGSGEAPRANQLVSPARARTVAVVERDADLDEAAKALVAARFAFRGRSPYAPDIVLVNEWVKTDFLNAVVRHSIKFLTESNGIPSGYPNGGPAEKRPTTGDGNGPVQHLLEGVKKDGRARIVTSGANGAILDVEKRDASILKDKVETSVLCVHAVLSLDDAIDCANSVDQLLAGYYYTTPQAGKYLAQFIASNVSFVNHIPAALLLGPAAPLSNSVKPILNRYDPKWFTVPRPQFISADIESTTLSEALTKAKPDAVRKLEAETLAELAPTKRRHKAGPDHGFFETGVHIGSILFLSTVLTTVGTAGFFLVKAALARYHR